MRGSFAFGNPSRYVQLRPDAAAALASRDDVRKSWDSALNYSDAVFNDRMYSLCGCNCHNFVAHFLEQIRFAGFHSWSIVYLVSPSGALIPPVHTPTAAACRQQSTQADYMRSSGRRT